MNAWVLLLIAGLLEVAWASSLKATAGFTRLGPSLFFGITLAGSMFLLALAAKTLPIGTAYAVWVGVGAAGTAVVSMLFHGEPLGFSKAFFLVLLVIAVVGLKLASEPRSA